jgi:hypothetical protein
LTDGEGRVEIGKAELSKAQREPCAKDVKSPCDEILGLEGDLVA